MFNRLIKKFWCICTLKLESITKKKEILSSVQKLVELKIIVLNKISQNQKDKCCMFYFIGKIFIKTQRHAMYLCIMYTWTHINKHTHAWGGECLNLCPIADLYSHSIINYLQRSHSLIWQLGNSGSYMSSRFAEKCLNTKSNRNKKL